MSDDLPDPIEWFSQAPPGRITLFVLASIGTILTNIITWKHMFMHFSAGLEEAKVVVFFPEIRKKVLYQIFWVNVISGTAYLSLLLPKTRLFLEFLNASYEAWALLGFLRMLIDMMGGRLRTLRTLENRPPQKLMSVMPCCCWRPCDKPRTMTPELMAVCRVGALQAAVIRPLLSAVNLFIQLKGGYQLWTSDKINLILNILQTASKMASVYFIFVMYGSAEGILGRFNARIKFILLRFMFIPFIVQASLISFIFLYIPPHEDDIFPKGIAAQAWQSCLVSIEVLPLAILVYFAYPVHEFNLDMMPPKLDILHQGSSQQSIASPVTRHGYEPLPGSEDFEEQRDTRSIGIQVDFENDMKDFVTNQPVPIKIITTETEEVRRRENLDTVERQRNSESFIVQESSSQSSILSRSLHYIPGSSFFSKDNQSLQ